MLPIFLPAAELFVGRMAQLGFAASLIGEAFTGKGALAQFGLETGMPASQSGLTVSQLGSASVYPASPVGCCSGCSGLSRTGILTTSGCAWQAKHNTPSLCRGVH